jgi:hypothetical protein
MSWWIDPTDKYGVVVLDVACSSVGRKWWCMGKKSWGQIVRGSFRLGDGDKTVLVSSTGDFMVNILAQNSAELNGGVQFRTPPSQFRDNGEAEEQDGLVLDVPASSSLSLGAIGGAAEETLEFSATGGASLTVFFTVTTSKAANVTMEVLPLNGVNAEVKTKSKRKVKRERDSLNAKAPVQA